MVPSFPLFRLRVLSFCLKPPGSSDERPPDTPQPTITTTTTTTLSPSTLSESAAKTDGQKKIKGEEKKY